MTDAGRAETAALVAAGGFVGANLRYLVDGALPGLGGTLLVNAVGSLALGWLLADAMTDLLAGRHRLVFGTGLLASFTTYSTFAVETLRAPGAWPLANLLATYALGFAGVLVGQAVARRVGGAWA
ncbi:MAG: CrcB family protein [Halobacteriaceae archaeon]